MPETSKELLDDSEKPSVLESLLLGTKDPASPSKLGKHRKNINPTERPSIIPISKSQVLGKVRDFLGIMAKANEDLEVMARDNPCSNYDIEVLNGDEKQYIEMGCAIKPEGPRTNMELNSPNEFGSGMVLKNLELSRLGPVSVLVLRICSSELLIFTATRLCQLLRPPLLAFSLLLFLQIAVLL